MESEELESEKARERLELDQARNQPPAFQADAKIDHQEIWMRRLFRHLQAVRDRGSRMPREFRRASQVDEPIRRPGYVIGEVGRQEDRCFRNPKIRRPPLGFVHATQKRRVLVRGEISVELGTKLRIHNAKRQPRWSRRERLA